ncbi:MAG: hypothetical protein IPK07_34055 [Deltaproteobacteria bacterium]|nr:hypothetical protein [Deltaproteobacteria bacterium]
MGGSELPDGPELAGRSARGWEEHWTAELKQTLEDHFDAYRDAAAAGTLDWGEARAFLLGHRGNELEQRWTATVTEIDRAHARRDADRYHFECIDPAETGYCSAVQAALTPKAARPLSSEAYLSGGEHAEAFGTVRVAIEIRDFQGFRWSDDADTPSVRARFQLPRRLDLVLEVTTHRGRSSRDGERRLSVTAPSLDQVYAGGLDTTTEARVTLLRGRMSSELANLAAQTVTP